ncbi:hypothetical protein BGX38DRAFT_1270236 [Terfezia claveryi]|nr:hypothetical protein BGX38DRAFT_1270236 [Terfezia claveryi]
MAPIAMVPFLAYNRQVSRNHWSGNPTPVQEQTPVGAVGSTRSYTPQYYSEDHRSRDQELEDQFRSELRALRKKYKEEIWTRLWALSRKFREQFDRTFVDEEGALKLSFDKVIRENIRDSFFSLRHDLIKAYKVNKQLIPTELGIECEREEQQLRDKFYDLSNNIKREAKSQFHLEIFDTILILDESPPAEQGPLSSIVEEAAVPEQQVEEVAGGSAPQEKPDPAQEIKRQENLEETNLLAEPQATEEPVQNAASQNSKNSSGTASKRSLSSAKSRRSDQESIHSNARLQETSLRIKTPVNLMVTTQGLVSPPIPDPVPVKRNFWGKIIGTGSFRFQWINSILHAQFYDGLTENPKNFTLFRVCPITFVDSVLSL